MSSDRPMPNVLLVTVSGCSECPFVAADDGRPPFCNIVKRGLWPDDDALASPPDRAPEWCPLRERPVLFALAGTNLSGGDDR